MNEMEKLELKRKAWQAGKCEIRRIARYDGYKTSYEDINLDFEAIDRGLKCI